MNNELSKEELKKIKKEENKKILKVREVIGTHYVIVLALITAVGILLFPKLFGEDETVTTILTYIWYIIAPLIGSYILMKLHHNKLIKCINSQNYKKIKNYSIQDLVLIDALYIGFNYSVAIIPAIISAILSSIYIIVEMNKIYKNNQ